MDTFVAPNDGKLVGRDASTDEDESHIAYGKLKRDAEIAAGAASDALGNYLAARNLIRRDTKPDEDQINYQCAKLKRDAAAAAVEAASAYEEYARSLEK